MNVLAIAAHPDDIELCCFGTLVKYHKNGHKIFYALTTSGNQGSNRMNSREEIAAVREQEAKEAAALLCTEPMFLRFDDEGLLNTPESRRSIINCIRKANPDVILTHAPFDQSTDHSMTGKIVQEVLLSLQGKNIAADELPISKTPSLFFFDTYMGVSFQPDIYVDISDEMELKREAFLKHVSQREWMENFLGGDFCRSMEILSSFRGLQSGGNYAEGFIGHKMAGYMPNYRLLP